MILYLVHHGDAVPPDVDPRRPLSERGRQQVARLAEAAARRGARPGVVWHSGKLRSRQTAEEFWRAFVVSSAITLHITSVRGRNTHHLIEATFKAVARALRDAVRLEGDAVPSTKGVL